MIQATLSYTITVENKGNIVVSGLSFVDSLTANGKELVLTTPPTFVSSSRGSAIGIILPETATYVANYIIGQRASDTGVINSIVFTGNSG